MSQAIPRHEFTIHTATAQPVGTVPGTVFEITHLGDFDSILFSCLADEVATAGGDLDVTIQDSQDGVTFETLIAIPTQTADGVEAVSPARAPNKFIRTSSVVGAGGSTWTQTVKVLGNIVVQDAS